MISVLLFLVLFNELSKSMNICTRENFNKVSSYFARNVSEQNCGCQRCIRRCCKPGFTYRQQFCYGNSNESLTVPVYTNMTILVNVLSGIENFVVGTPDCVLFRLDFPSEEFYIKNDNKDVWVPQYNRFYNSNRYCVDELNGFTPFLCFTSIIRQEPEGLTLDETDTLGKNFSSNIV